MRSRARNDEQLIVEEVEGLTSVEVRGSSTVGAMFVALASIATDKCPPATHCHLACDDLIRSGLRAVQLVEGSQTMDAHAHSRADGTISERVEER